MQVLKETLRMFPAGANVTRRVAPEAMELGGYAIPKGVMISTPAYVLHHMPENFPQPESFSPERFLDGADAAAQNKRAFIPFSYGARDCPGQRLAMMQVTMCCHPGPAT